MTIKQLLNTNKSEQEDIIHEIEIISKFDNPNIVTYYHHFWEEEEEEEEVLYLVMKYCSGSSLRDKLSSN